MLTVNHTITSPYKVSEAVYSVKAVYYDALNTENPSPRPTDELTGVTLVMPDGSEVKHPHRQYGGEGYFERFYVMNEQGKTIATYSIM